MAILLIVAGSAGAQIDTEGWQRRIEELTDLRASRMADTTFVGTFVSITEPERNCGSFVDPETDEAIYIHCDSELFELQYRVEQVVQGGIETDQIVSIMARPRIGTPDLAEHRYVLLMLNPEYDSEISRYVPVYPENGSFASCGCRDSADERQCTPVEFDPPVRVDLRSASQFVIDQYEASAIYDVRGSDAICVRGQKVDSLHESLARELMAKDTEAIEIGCGLVESALCPPD